MKRLFAAIKIYPSDEFSRLYYEMRNRLKHEKIRWVAPGNIHITLKFFGETDEKLIPAINQALNATAKSCQSFDFELRNTGIFGSSYNPKVIWFGIRQSEKLVKLAGSVFEELDARGWKRDRQNFVPHLTIGRIKHINDKQLFQKIIDDFAEVEIQAVSVKEFHLYESILRKEGPEYKIQESYMLKGLSPE